MNWRYLPHLSLASETGTRPLVSTHEFFQGVDPLRHYFILANNSVDRSHQLHGHSLPGTRSIMTVEGPWWLFPSVRLITPSLSISSRACSNCAWYRFAESFRYSHRWEHPQVSDSRSYGMDKNSLCFNQLNFIVSLLPLLTVIIGPSRAIKYESWILLCPMMACEKKNLFTPEVKSNFVI